MTEDLVKNTKSLQEIQQARIRSMQDALLLHLKLRQDHEKRNEALLPGQPVDLGTSPSHNASS